MGSLDEPKDQTKISPQVISALIRREEKDTHKHMLRVRISKKHACMSSRFEKNNGSCISVKIELDPPMV